MYMPKHTFWKMSRFPRPPWCLCYISANCWAVALLITQYYQTPSSHQWEGIHLHSVTEEDLGCTPFLIFAEMGCASLFLHSKGIWLFVGGRVLPLFFVESVYAPSPLKIPDLPLLYHMCHKPLWHVQDELWGLKPQCKKKKKKRCVKSFHVGTFWHNFSHLVPQTLYCVPRRKQSWTHIPLYLFLEL